MCPVDRYTAFVQAVHKVLGFFLLYLVAGYDVPVAVPPSVDRRYRPEATSTSTMTEAPSSVFPVITISPFGIIPTLKNLVKIFKPLFGTAQTKTTNI